MKAVTRGMRLRFMELQSSPFWRQTTTAFLGELIAGTARPAVCWEIQLLNNYHNQHTRDCGKTSTSHFKRCFEIVQECAYAGVKPHLFCKCRSMPLKTTPSTI